MFNIKSPSGTPEKLPMSPQETPKRPQEASKRAPHGVQGALRSPEGLPNVPPKPLKDNFTQCHIIQFIPICIVIINIMLCPYFVACLLSYLLTFISLIILLIIFGIVVHMVMLFMSLMTLDTNIVILTSRRIRTNNWILYSILAIISTSILNSFYT